MRNTFNIADLDVLYEWAWTRNAKNPPPEYSRLPKRLSSRLWMQELVDNINHHSWKYQRVLPFIYQGVSYIAWQKTHVSAVAQGRIHKKTKVTEIFRRKKSA